MLGASVHCPLRLLLLTVWHASIPSGLGVAPLVELEDLPALLGTRAEPLTLRWINTGSHRKATFSERCLSARQRFLKRPRRD